MAKQRKKSPLTKVIKSIGPKIPKPRNPATGFRPSKVANIS